MGLWAALLAGIRAALARRRKIKSEGQAVTPLGYSGRGAGSTVKRASLTPDSLCGLWQATLLLPVRSMSLGE